ncbi:hypothetical protein RUND412_008709 [Rhizina undulata]
MCDFVQQIQLQMDLLDLIRPAPSTGDTNTFAPMPLDGDPLDYFKSFPPERQKRLLPLMHGVQLSLERRALRAKHVFQKSKARYTKVKKTHEALVAENARLAENGSVGDVAKKVLDENAAKSMVDMLKEEVCYEYNGEKYLDLFHKWETLRELLDEVRIRGEVDSAEKSEGQVLEGEVGDERDGYNQMELFFKCEALRELLAEVKGELELELKIEAARGSARGEDEESEEEKKEEA